MKRAIVIGLSVFLALAVNGAMAEEEKAYQPVPDSREGSFLPPPTGLIPSQGKGEQNPIISTVVTEKKDSPPPGAGEALPSVSPAAPEKMPGVDLGQPVASEPLEDVDPEAIGLLSSTTGGLGASLWQGTSKALVDRLLPGLALPTLSPSLNDLARRMLLTIAAVPETSGEKTASAPSFTALRVEKLLALGAVAEAWELAGKAPVGTIGPTTWRPLIEAALIGPAQKEICEKIPSFIKGENKADPEDIEWQKALTVCKLKAGDTGAVQLGLDLLREQKADDDTFMLLMTRNVLAGSKVPPRRLTPLRPLNLILLRHLDWPLPSELYAKPDASLVGELLQAKAAKEEARLGLAERAAATGVLSPDQLAGVYKDVKVSFENGLEAKGPWVGAAFYQKVQAEQDPLKKMEIIKTFLAQAEPSSLTGSLGGLVANVLETLPIEAAYGGIAGEAARAMALAGRAEKAMAWLKIAEGVRAQSPETDQFLIRNWPLFALSGLVGDGAFASELKAWLDLALTPTQETEPRLLQARAGEVLSLLSASGYAVPEEAWLRVLEAAPPQKRLAADPLLLDRLRLAGQAGRKGETVLLALLVDGAGATEVVRALRQVGLKAESQAYARELLAKIPATF